MLPPKPPPNEEAAPNVLLALLPAAPNGVLALLLAAPKGDGFDEPPPKGDGAEAIEPPPNGEGVAPKGVEAGAAAPPDPKGGGAAPNGVVDVPPNVFAFTVEVPKAAVPNPEGAPKDDPDDGVAPNGVLCVADSAAMPSESVPNPELESDPNGLEVGAPPKAEDPDVADDPKGLLIVDPDPKELVLALPNGLVDTEPVALALAKGFDDGFPNGLGPVELEVNVVVAALKVVLPPCPPPDPLAPKYSSGSALGGNVVLNFSNPPSINLPKRIVLGFPMEPSSKRGNTCVIITCTCF